MLAGSVSRKASWLPCLKYSFEEKAMQWSRTATNLVCTSLKQASNACLSIWSAEGGHSSYCTMAYSCTDLASGIPARNIFQLLGFKPLFSRTSSHIALAQCTWLEALLQCSWIHALWLTRWAPLLTRTTSLKSKFYHVTRWFKGFSGSYWNTKGFSMPLLWYKGAQEP